MRTVRYLEGSTTWPYARQSPNNNGRFANAQFLFGPGPEPTDWLVVLNDISRGYDYVYPRGRTIFVSGEPPARSFSPEYVNQFGAVISVDPALSHPNKLVAPPMVPWHVGIRSRDPEFYRDAMTFAQLEPTPAKTKLCSCITSNLRSLPGHRMRLAFIERLQSRLGDRIDFFGRGIRPIADKNTGLEQYRYHIALENTILQDYWTEKLADPFLRNCFPIYCGAPNVLDYFDPMSMRLIDVSDPDRATQNVAEILDSDIDRKAAEAVTESKRRVMWEYNILAFVARYIDTMEARGEPVGSAALIKPEPAFHPPLAKHIQLYDQVVGSVREAGRRLRQSFGMK